MSTILVFRNKKPPSKKQGRGIILNDKFASTNIFATHITLVRICLPNKIVKWHKLKPCCKRKNPRANIGHLVVKIFFVSMSHRRTHFAHLFNKMCRRLDQHDSFVLRAVKSRVEYAMVFKGFRHIHPLLQEPPK